MLGNTGATAVAVQEGVFTFVAKHYGKRYLCPW